MHAHHRGIQHRGKISTHQPLIPPRLVGLIYDKLITGRIIYPTGYSFLRNIHKIERELVCKDYKNILTNRN